VGRPAVILSAAGRRDRPSPGRTLGQAVNRTRLVLVALLAFGAVVMAAALGLVCDDAVIFTAGWLAGAVTTLAVEDV
jgi:hypothetical protein